MSFRLLFKTPGRHPSLHTLGGVGSGGGGQSKTQTDESIFPQKFLTASCRNQYRRWGHQGLRLTNPPTQGSFYHPR